MTRYDGSQSWREYRRILATRFGIEISRQPVETWRSVRGHTLHVEVWEPDSPATGTVIFVHGGGGNGRILAPFGDYIAGLGWRVLAPDLPGYGLTEPAAGYDGNYGEWPAVVAQMVKETDGLVVLLGFSIGGMTAAFAAQASSAADGVIVTTLLDMGDPSVFTGAARTRWLGILSLWGFKLMPWLIDRLSMPLAGCATQGNVHGFRDAGLFL